MGEAPQATLEVIGPRRMDYAPAVDLQHSLLERCLASGGRENFLVLLEHPPVLSIGRSGSAEEVLAAADTLRRRGVSVVRTSRGGRVTYHGPGQLVVYPVIDLKARGRNLHRYLRELEGWLIRLLSTYGIAAGLNPPHTGVWVGRRKIASIGIAVRRWVAYHGVALNVATDLSHFDLIVPCGIEGVEMTSMAALLGRSPGIEEVAERAAQLFADGFGYAPAGPVRQAEEVGAR